MRMRRERGYEGVGSDPDDQIEKGSVIIYCWSQNQLGAQTRGLVELKQGGMVDPKQNKNLVEEQVGGIPIEVGRNGCLSRAQTPEAVEQPAHEKAPHPALMSFSSCGSHNSCSSCHIELVHFQARHSSSTLRPQFSLNASSLRSSLFLSCSHSYHFTDYIAEQLQCTSQSLRKMPKKSCCGSLDKMPPGAIAPAPKV